MSENHCTHRTSACISNIHEGREVWKDVVGYEQLYQVSNFGRVKSLARMKKIRNGGLQPLPEKIKEPTLGPNSRLVVLWKNNKSKTFLLHRLVLTAFSGPCPEGMEACHNDGNHLHNYLDNLRWDTHASNQADRLAHGTSNSGREGNTCKLKKRALELVKLYESGEYTVKRLAELFSVSIPTVYYHCNKSRSDALETGGSGHA